MQDMINLAGAVAWPIVALLGVILLGPGGYLLKFAKTLGESLGDFNRSIPVLRDTAATLRSDVDMLLETSKNFSSAFSDEYKAIEERIDALSRKLSDQLSEVREVLNELDKSKIEESQEEIRKAANISEAAVDDHQQDSRIEELNADDMMESIKSDWDALSETLKARLGSPEYFDKRQIGAMAQRLSHRARLSPISKEQADLISDLHSQYKRFIRLTSSKEEWLTPEIYRGFMAGVKEASKILGSG